ncbi:extracellular solute-binding protein [Virgisporangium aurantiacum]|uniref:Sugar ABC transporter substrate-binding protein n=1 Tax=Virgisporangium aurantiacum TaxID=175570 RepID=A0A8J3Z5I1_9ACTN|nr:extracellular solute-binding protein [Virgisporangium aurantiacum]GIJ57889.1 sugar ABC transporter substrate-binding protein [Virgisporangium aurantiacum]
MATHSRASRRSLLRAAGLGAGLAAGAPLLAACGDDDEGGETGGNQTITWWHISNTDPMLTIWANLAKEFETANPGVKVEITPLENEAFKAKLLPATQAGNPPDLFHSWGGGVLQQQVDASLVKEIKGDWLKTISNNGSKLYQIGGKQYGVPFDVGMVGFWYNKDLFAKANISAPPTTWAELLEVVKKIKAAGVVPIALAGGEKWPAHFYWSYLAIRQAGVAGMADAAKTGAFDRPDFVTAGEKMKQLIDLDPFQPGHLGAKYSANDGQAAIMGNGQAAMELMGQWAPPTQAAYSSTKKGIGDKLGFFPFPALDGGKGKPDEVFGGGNGFAVGRNAPSKTMDFVKFLLTPESQRKAVEGGGILPVTQGAEDALKDPNLKKVQETAAKATGFQLYLDQAYPPAVGQTVNDSVAALVAKQMSPQQVAEAIAKAAK